MSPQPVNACASQRPEEGPSSLAGRVGHALMRLHRSQEGVAMTEYIMVFSLISFGSTVALLSTAVYVKAYRDFLVWWLAHPAI